MRLDKGEVLLVPVVEFGSLGGIDYSWLEVFGNQ